MRTRVKICGVSTVEQAKKIVSLGADAIGLLAAIDVNGEGIKRGEITKETARDIVSSLPPFVDSVLITSYKDIRKIVEACKFIGNRTIQISRFNDINESEVKTLRKELPYIKIINVIHMSDKLAIEKVKSIETFSDAILLDSMAGKQLGGTGIIHDWNLSRQIVRDSKIPVILAGGLTPENLKEAIDKVKPWGVDAHTGLENDDFSKNYKKIEDFIKIAGNKTN